MQILSITEVQNYSSSILNIYIYTLTKWDILQECKRGSPCGNQKLQCTTFIEGKKKPWSSHLTQKKHLTKANTLSWLKKNTLNKLGIESNCFTLIKSFYEKPTQPISNSIVKHLNFSPRIKNNSRMSTFAISTKQYIDILARTIWHKIDREEIKVIQIGKK